MISRPVRLEKLWTIDPTQERYERGDRLSEPWQGKVFDIWNMRSELELCMYKGKHEVLNTHPSASAVVKWERLFKTEKEAWEAYRHLLEERIEQLTSAIVTARVRIVQLSSKEKRKEVHAEHGEGWLDY